MKSLFFVVLLGLAACGVKHSSVDYGRTTVGDLIAVKGHPLSEENVPSSSSSKILVYENNEKFQTKGDVVTHGFRMPSGDEKSLIFWKHKFRDCDTITRKISKPQAHILPEFELKCAAEGLAVIYSEGSEFVSRVIENEKQ